MSDSEIVFLQVQTPAHNLRGGTFMHVNEVVVVSLDSEGSASKEVIPVADRIVDRKSFLLNC